MSSVFSFVLNCFHDARWPHLYLNIVPVGVFCNSHGIIATFPTIVLAVMFYLDFLLRLLGSWLNCADMFADLQLNISFFPAVFQLKEKTSRWAMERMSWLVGWVAGWLCGWRWGWVRVVGLLDG